MPWEVVDVINILMGCLGSRQERRERARNDSPAEAAWIQISAF